MLRPRLLVALLLPLQQAAAGCRRRTCALTDWLGGGSHTWLMPICCSGKHHGSDNSQRQRVRDSNRNGAQHACMHQHQHNKKQHTCMSGTFSCTSAYHLPPFSQLSQPNAARSKGGRQPAGAEVVV